jgi:hypothetical protein
MTLLLLACDEAEPSLAAVATVNEAIQTELIVSFEIGADQSGSVEFGETTAYGWTTPAVVGAEQRHVLLGLPADSEVHWRVRVDGEPGEDHTSRTGLLPAELTALSVVVDEATWTGFLLVPIVGTWQGSVILDARGRVVWYHASEVTGAAALRVLPSHGGTALTYNLKAYEDAATSGLETVSWEGELLTTLAVSRLAHDFVETEPGRFAVLQTERRVDGDVVVLGERIAEVAEGEQPVVVWSAFDEWSPGEVGNGADGGWTHANALRWDPELGEYQVGIRNFDSIVRVDRATGALVEALGGLVDTGWSFPEG